MRTFTALALAWGAFSGSSRLTPPERFGSFARTQTRALPTAVEIQGETVPDAALIKGVPRGMFVGRSMLTGRAVCLLFLSRGRVTRFIPTGGLQHFDWARHREAHPGDSGTWELNGALLTITWGDGGVHQGPLKETPIGIEFYGKRYSRPIVVTIAAVAGRWESTRGTAVSGGSGINATKAFIIEPNGRFRWTGIVGGEVAGRSRAARGETWTGMVTIAGSTILFHGDDGTVVAHTLLPAAGDPVVAFSLDSDLFTRVQ